MASIEVAQNLAAIEQQSAPTALPSEKDQFYGDRFGRHRCEHGRIFLPDCGHVLGNIDQCRASQTEAGEIRSEIERCLADVDESWAISVTHLAHRVNHVAACVSKLDQMRPQMCQVGRHRAKLAGCRQTRARVLQKSSKIWPIVATKLLPVSDANTRAQVPATSGRPGIRTASPPLGRWA